MARNRFTALYYLISEPRSVRLTYAAIYLCMVGCGLSLLLDTPLTFTTTVDSLVALICGGFATLGGAFGAVFSVTRFSSWERVGAVLCSTALSAYLFIALWAQFFSTDEGNRWPTVFLVLALLVSFGMRWWALRKVETTLTD